MSLFSKVFKKKENSYKIIKLNFNNNYIRVDERKNRYVLLENENVINDNRKCEDFEKTLIHRIDNNKNCTCPNCNKKLDKSPKRKTKCKLCGNYIYVVSSYLLKNQTMLLTENEKINLEKYRKNFFYLKQLSTTLYAYGITQNKFLKERSIMENKFSDIDVVWKLLNKHSIKEFNNLNLGLHNNVHTTMASILIRENKIEPALEEFSYVAFLDINGCLNSADSIDKSFNPEVGFIAPSIKENILDCKKHLNLSNEEFENFFIKVCKKRCKFKTPLTFKEAFNKIF